MSVRVALASPSAGAYSETFIRMQWERLPCVMRLHGGPVAQETIPGGPISPLRNLRGIVETAYDVAIKKSRWEGPQSREVSRRLCQVNADVLLANYGPSAAALVPACRAIGLPLVAHFHGYDAHRIDVVEHNRDAFEELGRYATAVIAVSERMRDALVSIGVPDSKIELVRCGADPQRFLPRSKVPATPSFLAVGRLVDKKAPYLTLLAFRKVLDAIPTATLTIVGDGILHEVVANLVEALDLGESVALPGSMPSEEIARAMQSATAFVQHSLTPHRGPSRGDSEGTPVAILEALISGVPVVATRHAGIAETVRDKETGMLVEERDIDGMANAMIALAQDPQMNLRMGEAARRDAMGRYTAEHYITNLLTILESAACKPSVA